MFSQKFNSLERLKLMHIMSTSLNNQEESNKLKTLSDKLGRKVSIKGRSFSVEKFNDSGYFYFVRPKSQ